ncbi:MAG: hypothetical protein ABW043_16790 [Devosia sp.]|uniref:hypothetical protein n=1 Tax=Devosia sp. TaxID=1871048 RepID=UPI003397E0C0
MIPLALYRLAKPFLPWIAGLVAVVGVVLWIRGMRAEIADLKVSNSHLNEAIQAEKLSRERDVAGLTALSSGLAKVSTDNRKDAAILAETIDAKNPAPSSPGLAALLDGLRAADQDGKRIPAAGSGR